MTRGVGGARQRAKCSENGFSGNWAYGLMGGNLEEVPFMRTTNARAATLQPGDSVLIHMAAGGVGIALLQLCSRVPGVTSFGTASPEKHKAIRAQGCQHPIDYRTKDYAREVMRLTQGEGVDVVFVLRVALGAFS